MTMIFEKPDTVTGTVTVLPVTLVIVGAEVTGAFCDLASIKRKHKKQNKTIWKFFILIRIY